jgi:hypothetical protein
MALVAAALISGGATAQIKLVSREKLDSVANPRTVAEAKMTFQSGTTLSFGTIAEDAGKWERVVQWHNQGDKSLVVTRITTSCSCLQAVAAKGEVKSGGKSSIKLTYYPKGHPGDVMQRVFIYTNLSSFTPSAVLTLKGKVTPSSDHSGDYPRSRGNLLLRRDTVIIAGDKPQTERIACLNNGSRAMRLETDDFSSKGLKLRTEPAVLAPGEEGDLVITLRGEKREKLKLYIEGEYGPSKREIKIE